MLERERKEWGGGYESLVPGKTSAVSAIGNIPLEVVVN